MLPDGQVWAAPSAARGSGDSSDLPTRRSLSDRLPDEFGHLQDEIGGGISWPGAITCDFSIHPRTHLTRPDADDIVEPPIARVLAQMDGRNDPLASIGRVGATIAVILEEDGGIVIGLNHPVEVGCECVISAATGKVAGTEAPVDTALDRALSKVEVLALAPLFTRDVDSPALRVDEAHTLEGFEPHLLPPLLMKGQSFGPPVRKSAPRPMPSAHVSLAQARACVSYTLHRGSQASRPATLHQHM
jgi:hypothetical protein